MFRLGLLGFPATYSLSPVIFEAAFRAAGVPGSYEIFPIRQQEFVAVVNRLAAEGYTGVNVTTPHKEAALRLAQNPTPDAALAHAANLLLFDHHGGIAAYNTDIPALARVVTEIQDGIPSLDSAMVLGSSGAARAAITTLGRDLAFKRITIAARDVDRMKEWADGVSKTLEGAALSLVKWDDKELIIANEKPALIINATSLGWHANDPYPIRPDLLTGVKFVLDLNYPRRNRWLTAVRERGIPCRDGKMMLLWQAALGFEIFTGVKAPMIEMRKALEKEA